MAQPKVRGPQDRVTKMATEFDAVQWAQINAPRGTGRDFNADFAEAVETREGLRSGMAPNQAVMRGMRARQAALDPMFELKKSQAMLNIATTAQQFQENILSSQIKKQQIDDEAADTLALSTVTKLPTWDEKLKALTEITPRSARGIQQASQLRLQLSQLRQMDWSSKAMLSIAQKNPALAMRLSTMDPTSPEFLDAVKAFEETSKPQSPFGKLQADLDAELSGQNRPEVVKRFIGAIEMASTNKGKSIYMGMDDNGKPIFQMSEGGATPIGTPTVATQSMTQKKLLKYEGAMELINDLKRSIKPEFLGARGVAGEMLVDRGLAQLAPELANRSRVDFRSGLIAARESLLREISDDNRFSNADREEISKALPSSGIFESLPDAQQRLDTVSRIISQRGKIYSSGSGLPPPIWSLTVEEIKAQHDKFKASGGKEGIDYNTALDALTRFH